jgi:hypothetical protein
VEVGLLVHGDHGDLEFVAGRDEAGADETGGACDEKSGSRGVYTHDTQAVANETKKIKYSTLAVHAHFHGTFDDIPLEYFITVLRKTYPHLFADTAQERGMESFFFNV